MRATDYLSATDLSKKTSATLDALERGDDEPTITHEDLLFPFSENLNFWEPMLPSRQKNA